MLCKYADFFNIKTTLYLNYLLCPKISNQLYLKNISNRSWFPEWQKSTAIQEILRWDLVIWSRGKMYNFFSCTRSVGNFLQKKKTRWTGGGKYELQKEALIWQDEALQKKRAKVIIVELWHHSLEQFLIEPGKSLLNMCQERKPCQR